MVVTPSTISSATALSPMPRSTANFIAYDLRPAKQAERRILIEYLGAASDVGLTSSDCRYVGMGGFKFYDFILMHRYVGMRRMVSIEHDAKIIDRCTFNKPYGGITIKSCSANDFIRNDNGIRSVYWLDYDDSLGDEIVDDIQLLGLRLAVDSFAFVTVAADIPADLIEFTEEERLESLRDQFGVLAVDVTIDDVEESTFPSAIYKILYASFKDAFAGRGDGVFFPDFRIQYKDSTTMLTIGGVLTSRNTGRSLQARLKNTMPFLNRDPDKPFRIRNFNLSERERHLIEVASTKSQRSRERTKLESLGIKKADLNAYRDLVRFMPRYFETIF